MRPRVAILAALPRELAPLVQDWPVNTRSHTDSSTISECDRAIAVCAGMGQERVTHALELAEGRGPICSIVSVGYAGALHSGYVQGRIYWPAAIIEGASGERFHCDGGTGTLLTVDHVVQREGKPPLAQRWNADLVDMEAAVVAKLARMRGLPFRALKVVSDEAGDRLPDFHRFMDERGAFREAAFVRHIMFRPWLIPASIRLAHRSAQASQLIATALREYLGHTE